MSRFLAAWRRFWFGPMPTAVLEVFQRAVGVIVVSWVASVLPDARTFYLPGGLGIDPGLGPTLHTILGWSLVGAMLIGGVLLLLCRAPRAGAVLGFIGLTGLYWMNPFVMSAAEELLRVYLFFLVLAPGRLDARSVPIFPLRLLQLQVSLLYLLSVGWKLAGSMWRNGTVVAYAFQLTDIARFTPPDVVADNTVLMAMATYGAIGTEVAIGMLLWFRRTMRWAVLLGLLLHGLIDATMLVGFFGLTAMAGYCVFMSEESARRIVGRLPREVNVRMRSRPRVLAAERGDVGSGAGVQGRGPQPRMRMP